MPAGESSQALSKATGEVQKSCFICQRLLVSFRAYQIRYGSAREGGRGLDIVEGTNGEYCMVERPGY